MELGPITIIDWRSGLNDGPRPFNLVNQGLQQLGCVSIDRFLFSTSDAGFDMIQHTQFETPITKKSPTIQSLLPEMMSPNPPSSSNAAQYPSSAVKMQNVAHLHQTCQRTFGSSDALKFDFIQEGGPQTKQCILTITRPNGSVRSYKTEPTFSRKTDAKAECANIAIDMGALDFIITGDSEALKLKKGMLLTPLDADADSYEQLEIGEIPQEPTVNLEPVKAIENCCAEWRAGLVEPYWVSYQEPKSGNSHGAALRILLTPHAFRIYSTDTIYPNAFEAKIGCANLALTGGVLDYIKHGNGQTAPTVLPHEADNGRIPEPVRVPTTAISLQDFYESLPQPFPEPVGDKTAMEINGPAWFNTTLQSARGGRLKAKFIWVMDGLLGLHGCLLRLERPGGCKSYFADPRFARRVDSKAAVCLLAMSQGIGDYIRSVGAEAENRLSHYSRELVNQVIYPTLTTECSKIRPHSCPEYTFFVDRDAFGCTLKVDLSPDAEKPDLRQWTVEPEYRNKADAKVAVSILAAEGGVFELLRFHGMPPPPDHVPFWDTYSKQSVITISKKRKDFEASCDNITESKAPKKQKLESTDDQRNSSGNKQGLWKPSASGSRSLAPLSGLAQTAGHSTGQRLHGNRSVGHSTALYNPSHFGIPSSFMSPYAPLNEGWHESGGGPFGIQYGYQLASSASFNGPMQPCPPAVPFYYTNTPVYPQPPQRAPLFPIYPHAHEPVVSYNAYPYPQNVYPASRGYPYPSANVSGTPNIGFSQSTTLSSLNEAAPNYDEQISEDVPEHMELSLRRRRKRGKKGKGKGKEYNNSTNSNEQKQGQSYVTDEPPPIATNPQEYLQSGTGIPDKAPKSNVVALIDFCVRETKPQPHFHSEVIHEDAVTKYKIWVTMGSERLELPGAFRSLEEGKERVAKQILIRLQETNQGSRI